MALYESDYGLLPIHKYARDGNFAGLKAELEAGVDPNVKTVDWFSETPLIYALKREEKLQCIELLLNYKACPNLMNHCGSAPLRFVVFEDAKFGTVDMLLDHGATIDHEILLENLRWGSETRTLLTFLERVPTETLRDCVTEALDKGDLIANVDENNFLLYLKEAKWRDSI